MLVVRSKKWCVLVSIYHIECSADLPFYLLLIVPNSNCRSFFTDGGTSTPLQLPEQEETGQQQKEYESSDVTIVINNEEAIRSKQIDIGEQGNSFDNETAEEGI